MLSQIMPAFLRRQKETMTYPPDFSDDDIQLIEKVRPFTMISPERILSIKTAVRYIHTNGIPGSIVECGVWRGGSMMVVAITLLQLGDTSRDLYLFDTFEGMTAPSDKDVDFTGTSASELLVSQDRTDPRSIWCYASIEEVMGNMVSTGYPRNKIHLVKGRVEDTLPRNAPDCISLLRLDTDWYESTLHELNCLYPRLSRYGVLIIDDYGHWKGAKEAVNQYFQHFEYKPFLHRVDYTGRVIIKV